MLRFASSLLASAVIVFLGTTLLGTTTLEGRCGTCPTPRHIISRPIPPKVIATVVAHGHEQSSSFTVHGL